MSKFGTKGTVSPAGTAPQRSNGGAKAKTATILDIRMVDTKNGKKTKVQFAKGVTISFNGQEINLGEYNSAFLKDRTELEADLEFLVSKEYMNEEQANAEVDRIEEKGITYVFKTKLG